MVKTCAQMAAVGTALVLSGLLTACSGDPGTPGPTTSATTSAAPTTTSASTTTTTSRNLSLPPGVGPFNSAVCVANLYSSSVVNGLTGYYDLVKKGRTISDTGWQEIQTVLPDAIASSTPQRSLLQQYGVPASFPAYQDSDEVLAAMNAVLDAGKAKDPDKLAKAFERLRTASQVFSEDCGALTRS
jgi:hypothetical protein